VGGRFTWDGGLAFQGIDFPGEGGTLKGDGARNLDGDVRKADGFCGLTEGKRRVGRICPGVRGTAAENVRTRCAVPVLAGGGFLLGVACIVFAE
jgi:hypothetical protein